MAQTIPDWLTRAAAATDPTEVERCLEQATSLAASCHDWRTLLGGIRDLPLAPRERLREVTHRTLESAAEERQVWGFRDVASARATRLDDPIGARDALEACFALFQKPRTDLLARAAAMLGKTEVTRGYEWVLLGQGFVEVLQDSSGMQRCLEAGRDSARAQQNADDLCEIATEWAKRMDRVTGVELLREAETLANNGSAQPWTLANAWHALDDQEAVHRVLDGALQKATSSAQALHVARAWASHEETDEVRGALARARDLATTGPEWLAIGEAAFDARLGEEAVREAVTRAETLAVTDETRSRVASAYKQWLGDEEASARCGPRGHRPEALRNRVRRLPEWESSASDLFDWLRARVPPETLVRIAAADYGTGADKHLAALQDICETGLVPRTLAWEPHEVLALARWSSGETVDHLERALCCAILCLGPSDMDELVTNGPILVESCLALGSEASRLAARFFAWHAETEEAGDEPTPDDDIGPEQPIALLLLLLLGAAEAPDDPRLEALSRSLTEHPTYTLESVARQMSGSMSAELWVDLVDRLLVPLEDTRPFMEDLLSGLGL